MTNSQIQPPYGRFSAFCRCQTCSWGFSLQLVPFLVKCEPVIAVLKITLYGNSNCSNYKQTKKSKHVTITDNIPQQCFGIVLGNTGRLRWLYYLPHFWWEVRPKEWEVPIPPSPPACQGRSCPFSWSALLLLLHSTNVQQRMRENTEQKGFLYCVNCCNENI